MHAQRTPRAPAALGATALIAACLAPTALAQEAQVNLHSTVSGNRELPKVMYIVPWQQPAAAQFDYELHNSIAEELFTPMDRDEFLRGLVYSHELQQRSAADGTHSDTESR